MRTARKRTAPTNRTDDHELLDVPAGASLDEIKRAYRHLAHEVHPDTNPGDPAAAEDFRRLTEAYEALAAGAPVADDPLDQVPGRKGTIWNVFTDQPRESSSAGAADAPTGAGSSAEGFEPTMPSRLARLGRLFDRSEPLIELPPAVADRVVRTLMVLPFAWALAGFPGLLGRGLGDVGPAHAVVSAAVALAGWVVIGALLWARAPVVASDPPRWRSPGWDGTALIVRLVAFFALAYAATAVVLVPRLEASDGTPSRPVILWGLLVAAAWVASAHAPRRLGYQSRFDRYWRLDSTGLPPRSTRPRRPS